jgi:hypothetical protein
MEKLKSYIIVTEFNEWVGTPSNVTMDELKEEVIQIRERLVADGKPADTDMIAYEVNLPGFNL